MVRYHPSIFFVAFAAFQGTSRAQFGRIDKPTLWNDGLPLSDYPKGLQSVAAKWEPVGAPDKCADKANEMQGCPLETLEARRVTYADCETPWILCRCANATMSMDTITERFGWVPVGVRSYVGGLIVSPEPVASASASGDFLNFNGECVVPVFIHESGHTLDQGSSSNMDWIHSIENSTCVADYYSQTNAVENFAQVTVVYSYLTKHGSVPGDTTCMKPQLDFMMNTERIATAQNTKTCLTDKRPFILEPSNRVPIGTAGSYESSIGTYKDPNASMSSSSSASTTSTLNSVKSTIPSTSSTQGASSDAPTPPPPSESDIGGNAASHHSTIPTIVLFIFAVISTCCAI